MPSASPKQHRFMEAIAHDPKFAKKAGVPQKVGRDFASADGDTSVRAPRADKGKRRSHPRNHAEFEALGRD